jgi:O-antigen/teichoic acid export membrane protein
MNRIGKKLSSNQYNKLKTITGDMFLNIIASIMPVFILQFILLPIVAQKYDEFSYGLMLTLLSLVTLSVQSLSVSLTNSRLLLNHKYSDENLSGDFNIILLAYTIINIIVLSIGTFLYEGKINIVNIILILFISVIQLFRRYLLVSFRIDINYKGILLSNSILVVGYIIGMLVFMYSKIWQSIYIFGELFSLVYVVKKTNLYKEPIRITKLFKGTIKHSVVILGASFLGTANSHIDRLLLYPMLGAKMVTIYYVSTLFGKTISMLVGPINNVILTYISKMRKFEIDSFKIMLTVASAFGLISYFVIVIISESVLQIIYPDYVDAAMKLIYITTLTSIVMMLSTVINPVVLKFCNITWQVWINLINIIVYIVLTYILVGLYGIYGFCYAALISSLVKLLMLIYVYISNHKKLSSELV